MRQHIFTTRVDQPALPESKTTPCWTYCMIPLLFRYCSKGRQESDLSLTPLTLLRRPGASHGSFYTERDENIISCLRSPFRNRDSDIQARNTPNNAYFNHIERKQVSFMNVWLERYWGVSNHQVITDSLLHA